MKVEKIHPFDVSLEDAKNIQNSLRAKLALNYDFPLSSLRIIAGCDVAFSKDNKTAFGAVVLLDYPSMEIVEVETAETVCKFPYIPGFLSFREMEPLMLAFEKIEADPDVVFVDGQGIAHPRGFGIACHLGLLLNKPAIGCAKSRLVGTFDEPGTEKGKISPLIYNNETVGAVVRTRKNVKPIFISQGNKISLERAIEIALLCSRKYRVPEPTRLAHIEVSKIRL